MSDIPSRDLPRRTLAGGLSVYPVGIGCWAIGGPDVNLGLPMGWSTADDSASLRGLETAFALGANAERGASVLINKPLAQGLLTGKYDHAHPPTFGVGDHRLRKSWFTPKALQIIQSGLQPLRVRFGQSSGHLVRVALHYCLQHADNAAVLVGFTTPEQVAENLTMVGDPLADDDLAFIRETAGRLQRELDAAGEVFLDEREAQHT